MAYAEKTCQKMCFLNIFGGAGTNLGYASIHHQLNIFLSVCQFFCLSVYLFICLSVGLSNFISVCLSIYLRFNGMTLPLVSSFFLGKRGK